MQTTSSTMAFHVCAFAYKFTGKERDAESGNDYFGARYYASSMGRFMSPDPLGIASGSLANPQSLNLYSYVLNNPLIFTARTEENVSGTMGATTQTTTRTPEVLTNAQAGVAPGSGMMSSQIVATTEATGVAMRTALLEASWVIYSRAQLR